MKRIMLCGIVLLTVLQVMSAQERKPWLLAGYAHTLSPYLEDGTLDGFFAGISWPLATRWALSMRSGLQSGSYTTTGRTFGGVGETLLWDNTYAYSQRERLTHLDVVLFRELMAPESRFGLRLGAGTGLIYQHYRYPEEVVLFRGEILSQTDVTYTAWKPSILFSLAGSIRVAGPWHLQGGMDWRPTLRALPGLKSQARHDFGQGGTNVSAREMANGPEWFTHFTVGLAYQL